MNPAGDIREPAPPCRLDARGVVLLLLLTGVYLAVMFYFPFPPVVRYLLLGGVGFFALFFVRPEPRFWLPLMPLVFMLGGTAISIGEFNPSLATLVMFGFSVIFLLDRLAGNGPVLVLPRSFHLVTLGLVFQIGSVFVSIHRLGQYPWNAVREGAGLYLFLPMAIIIPAVCRNGRCLKRLLRSMVLALLVASLIGVIQYLTKTGFSREDAGLGYIYKGRIAGVFGNGNIFAGYLELTLPITLSMLLCEKSFLWRLISSAALLLGILSVLYTFSRAGLLCMAMGLGLTMLYVFRTKPWIPILVCAAAILLLFMYADTFERQMSFFQDPHKQITQPTILHRYVSYRGFINQIEKSYPAGVGWGAREYFWGGSRLYSFWEVRHTVSHRTIRDFGGLNSLFFNQAVKGGLLGILSLLALFAGLASAFTEAFVVTRERVLAVAVAAGILSLSVHQVVDCLLKYPTVNSMFWMSVGILFALAKRKDIRLREKPGIQLPPRESPDLTTP